MNDRSKKNIIKTLCAAAAVIAAVTLAVCCKSDVLRTATDSPDGISTPKAASSSSSTPAAQNSENSDLSSSGESAITEATAETTAVTTAETTAETTVETTAVSTAATTAASSAEATTAATTAAAVQSTQASAATTAPKPLWTETEYKKQLYITVDCYSRKEALIGSEAVKLMKFGKKVNTVAITDTGYYKLEDGSFVHGDYLSETKPVVTTAATTKAPSTTLKPASSTPKPAVTNPPSGNSGTSQTLSNASEYEQEVFRLINEIRRDYGLAEFKWDDAAYRVATTRAGEIVHSFGHTRPDGSSPYSLYGVSSMWDVFSSVGENIAAGQKTPAEVVDSWMSSTKGHRENILNPNFENLAVAFLQGGGKYGTYWVQEFNTYR